MRNFVPNVLLLVCLIFTQNVDLTANNNSNILEVEECLDCITAPIIICPSTYFGCPTNNIDPSVTGFPTAMPGDINCPMPIVTYTDVYVTNTPCLKVIHRTWLAEYPPGSANIKLHSQCQQTLVLEDLELPVIENCPADITIDLVDNCAGIATWNIPTATDDCGIQYFTTTHNSGTPFPLGTTPVTYTAQDWCVQETTCAFNVTVVGSCCSAISLICPTDRLVCVGGDTTPTNTGFAIPITNDPSCPTPLVTYVDSTLTTFPCLGSMLLLRTWTATDTIDSTITASCLQLISVSDLQQPIITDIPSNINVSGTGTGCNVVVTWPDLSVFDNCGIASFDSNYSSGDLFSEGFTLVIYTATDNCGNTAQGAFLVTVTCQAASCSTAPNLICPNFYSSCPSVSNPSPLVSGYAITFPGNIDCNQPLLVYSDIITSTGNCPGTKTIDRTWTATDPNNSSLSTSCVQAINLSDDTLPTITNVPSDITVTGSNSGCSVPISWNLPAASDNCGIASFDSDYPIGSTFNEGTTTITYTAIDNCGNSATASFLVTVTCTTQCTTLPTLFCPQNFTSCPSLSIPNPSISGYAVALPGSVDCNQPILSFIDNITSTGICSGVMTVERTWIATDPNNTILNVNCIQTITLEDNDVPIITNVPMDFTVNGFGNSCMIPVSWNSPTFSDSCGIVSSTSNIASGSFLSEGVTTIIYTATDNCGQSSTASFDITIFCFSSCVLPPVITGPQNYWACPTGSIPGPDVSGWATATPGSVDCATPTITYSDSILNSGLCLGADVIERTWTATDPSNSSLFTTYTQIISLEDTNSPYFVYCPANLTVIAHNTNCTAIASWSAVTATDNCSLPDLNAVDQYGTPVASGSVFNRGLNTVTYTATDLCGNTAECEFNVTVTCAQSCNTAPSITCPSNKIICPGSNSSASILGWATAYAGINCPTPVVNYQDVITSNGPCAGEKIINRIWTASYNSGSNLTSSCIQVIAAKDELSPTFTNCPSDIIVYDNMTVVNWSTPVVTDFCSIPSVTSTHQSGQYFPVGTTTVTYTAIDNCGNLNYCSFNITVQNNACNSAPSITCPSDKVICPGSSSSASILGWATAYAGSNCPTPVVNYQDIITATGPCHGQKVINRTWTASYNSGSNLTSSCVQIINAKDVISPTFTNCPNDIIVDNNTTIVNWNAPIVSDFCSIPSVTSTHQPGNYFPVGTTNVVYTAIDNCGNVNYCNFNVTVLYDNLATITCPSDIYLTCDSTGGAIANWTAPEYEGTCGNCNSTNTIAGFVYMGTFNGNQYYCSTGQATWPQAQQICNNNGGYLASINDDAENQFLADILTLQSAWIGLSDAANEGDFVWDNGDPLDYTNWYINQPNNYNNNQDYVEMLNSGLWNDQYNHYALEFIMEVPCTYIQQTGGPEPGSFLTGGTYTVTYALSDACGANSSCSFDIIVDGGLIIECPSDISVSAPANSNGITVDWEDPNVFTCCNNCNDTAGGAIPNFVYMGTFGGHYYYCSTQADNWESAKQNCEINDGYLAVINDEYENAFLANLLNTQSAWIGLSDNDTEGNFEWVNGDDLNYTNWYPGQPNNYNNNQDFVELLNNGQWNDQYNTYNLEYIMELPGCLNVTQTAGPTSGSLLLPGSYHTVTYAATDGCGNTETCSFDINVESIPTNKTYCTSSGVISLNYYIDSVVLGSLNNPSGDNGGYGDFTYKCYNVDQNISYALQLDPGYEGQPDDKVYWKVWIDFNQDGDFEDDDEYVAYGCGTSTLSGTIVMPQILTPGETRMRIIMKPGSYATGPCDNYQYGETEDYCLSIWGTGTIISNEVINSRSAGSSPVHLQENNSTFDVEVYPNPAIDYININLEYIDNITAVTIYNNQGMAVIAIENKDIQNKNKINVSTLNSGMYLISVENNNGDKLSKKIMIQK